MAACGRGIFREREVRRADADAYLGRQVGGEWWAEIPFPISWACQHQPSLNRSTMFRCVGRAKRVFNTITAGIGESQVPYFSDTYTRCVYEVRKKRSWLYDRPHCWGLGVGREALIASFGKDKLDKVLTAYAYERFV